MRQGLCVVGGELFVKNCRKYRRILDKPIPRLSLQAAIVETSTSLTGEARSTIYEKTGERKGAFLNLAKFFSPAAASNAFASSSSCFR